MSDVASAVNGLSPRRAGKPVREAVRKIKAEARSFADPTDTARDKLVAAAARRIRLRREVMRRWAREQAHVAGRSVQNRPVTAIAAALGVGVVIGLLARR
jgi:ElaB/YqjD/DUF883 family membrane-anchored ribosome-binding protein